MPLSDSDMQRMRDRVANGTRLTIRDQRLLLLEVDSRGVQADPPIEAARRLLLEVRRGMVMLRAATDRGLDADAIQAAILRIRGAINGYRP